MQLFNVYPTYPIEPVKARDCFIWDANGKQYLDLYGGHAVISIGHCHPHYISRIKEQLDKIGFYSNSIINSLQKELADNLGSISGYDDYNLFLCNSGAEANENALKLASFHTGKDTVITFTNGFHGRTSGAVAVTDNPKIKAPFNQHHKHLICPLNDIESVEKALKTGSICAVMIEGIQGLAGVFEPDPGFLLSLEKLCKQYHAVLILDEVQSGYGRSGKFFAHQHYGIRPDIITTAKGMGNGFPIGGVLINPEIKGWSGMLGSTFGGNHLACVASIAVLEVIENESLMKKASEMESNIKDLFKKIDEIKEIRGKGLLIGFEFSMPVSDVRSHLIHEHQIFTGGSADKNTLRILPPLTVKNQHILQFKNALENSLKNLSEKTLTH